MMLDLIAGAQDIQLVSYYLQQTESYQSIKVDKYPGAFVQLTAEHFNSAASDSINLLQGEFQKTSPWMKLLRMWKWILGLFVILLAVTSYNRAIALEELESQLLQLKSNQYELLKDYLPATIKQSDDLKKELIILLKQNQSSSEDASFLELLRQFTQAKSAYASVIIGKIGYQGKRLSIDITSNQLSDLESLLEAIESTGRPAKLENLNIKPDNISGQFVLDGAS